MALLEHQSADENERTLYLIRVARAERQQDVTFPLARITTCGTLTIEVLRTIHRGEGDHPEAIYGPPDATLLAQKGASTAFTLLALLASQPGNFATKDWLSEKLGHLPKEEDEDGEGLKRVDNVVTLLRKLLYPARPHESWDEQLLRRRLVAYQRASGETGPGYRLAGMPLVWLDVEQMREHVKRARRLEQFGKDGLTEWRAAYDLGMQGRFLPQEAYSDWAAWRRQEIEAHLWDSVQTLWRRYAGQGEAGETEALRVLCAYWQSHVTKEDALRPLLELLGKREWYGQAEEYYQQLCTTLAQEGRQPDLRTREVMDFLHAAQIQRKQTIVDSGKTDVYSTPVLFSSQRRDSFPDFSHLLTHGLETSPSVSIPPSRFQADFDVLTRLSAVLNNPSDVHEGEIVYFDQQTRLYWRAREETALPTMTLYTSVISHIDNITLLLARSHLPTLRLYLCEVVCRTVLLAGILLYDMGQYTKAREQYLVAFQAATEANNRVLQAIVWGWTSFTWTYTKCYTEALRCIQYARRFAEQASDIIVQAWLGAIEAEIQAHLFNRDACLQSLDIMERGMGTSPSQDISYLFEFNPVLLLGYKGVCLQQFYQRQEPATHALLQEAQRSLELALASETPPKRKLYYLTDLAGVYARQGEAEKACAYILQSLPLMKQVGSGSKTIRQHLFQARALLQPYASSSYVQTLDEQIAPLLIEAVK